MLGLAYTFRAILTHIWLRRFTVTDVYGRNIELTSARILLSLSPPITLIRAPALTSQTVPLWESSHNPCLNILPNA